MRKKIVLAALAALALGTSAYAGDEADHMCEHKFERSQAADTCRLAHAKARDGMCIVRANCKDHEDRKVHNKIEAKPRAIQRLVNCDGHLAEICASSEATGS